MSSLMRLLVAVLVTWNIVLSTALASAEWPAVQTPVRARVQVVAKDIILNGVPARVIRFDVKSSVADVMEFYRAQFGTKRVENRLKDTQIIATQQGNYFLTVQLRSLLSDTVQGTLMITQMQGGGGVSGVALDTQKILPSASSVLNTMQSNDDGKQSVMVLGANNSSVQTNRDHLVGALQSRGFKVIKQEAGQLEGREETTLSLESATEQITATIVDAGRYRSVLINRVRESK
jgi:hypothetical protein